MASITCKERQRAGRAFAFLIAMATACHASVPSASEQVATGVSVEAQDELERRIYLIANEVANQKPWLEDDPLPMHITATFERSSNVLVLDMGERLGPRSGDGSLEDLQSEIQLEIWPLIKDIPGFKWIDWRFGGKDLYHWFPGDRPKQGLGKHAPGGPDVLISAGHGYYYHHGYKDWRPQREMVNGILEDEITTQYAEMLHWSLINRGVSADRIRQGRFDLHEPSAQPYLLIAARYQIEDRLSDRPDIWHSLPNATDHQRERREDIRSRPLYANEQGAGTLIHLHTNAAMNPSARGAKVFHHKDSPQSARLGSMILCYMGEAIHSVEKYEDFPVDSSSIQGNHGENRLASMPSVIVELGFHTNPDDAEALKDYQFMSKSMEGLIKGYRLFEAGEACDPLIADVPNQVQGVLDGDVQIPVSVRGLPEFPVIIDALKKECDGGCWVASRVAQNHEQMSDVNLKYRCKEEGKEVLKVVVSDRSHVRTKPVDVSVTCLAGEQMRPS